MATSAADREQASKADVGEDAKKRVKQLKANVKKYRDVLGEHAESIPSVSGEDSTQDQPSGASRTRGSLRRPRPSALQSKHVRPSGSNKRASSLGADADAK